MKRMNRKRIIRVLLDLLRYYEDFDTEEFPDMACCTGEGPGGHDDDCPMGQGWKLYRELKDA